MTIALYLTSIHANALEFKVAHPYEPAALIETTIDLEGSETLGAITIKILEESGVEYLGNERGIHSILNTPIGDEAIEIISDTEMKVYGWCFEVDGRTPVFLADQVELQATTKIVEWFFGFARYKDGEWVSYCSRS